MLTKRSREFYAKKLDCAGPESPYQADKSQKKLKQALTSADTKQSTRDNKRYLGGPVAWQRSY